MNLQPVKIYLELSTASKRTVFRVIQFVYCSVYSLKCTALQYTIHIYKGTKIKRLSMLVLAFRLGQALLRHHKQYFPFRSNRERIPNTILHLYHHRLKPWLAADQLCCRVVDHTLSIFMKRKKRDMIMDIGGKYKFINFFLMLNIPLAEQHGGKSLSHIITFSS